MNRRKFLATALAAPLAGGLSLPLLRAHDASSPSPKWRRFLVSTRIALPETAGPARLWVPLAQTTGGYQSSLDLHWSSTGHSECICDARYSAPMLRTTWEETDRTTRSFETWQTIDVRDRIDEPFVDLPYGVHTVSPLLPLTEAERKFWTASTESVPLDGIIRKTAAQITTGKETPRERLRAIYDWVIDHTHRDPDVPGCGRGDIKGMLERSELGGKCVDINGLMVGLARAAGFPARDVYGIRVAPSRFFPSLGATGDISKAQHCRAEVFLDGFGWFPVDPADVRKVVLTDKLSLDSPEGRALRDRLFGNWEMNWVGYNSATDIELPGGGASKPDFAFLMYPCAFTSEGNCPCTDPAKFRYDITSRDITV